MGTFTVSKVIDGDTFEVTNGWTWTRKDGTKVNGTTIRPTGYNTPEEGKPGYSEAKQKLKNLIEGKSIVINDGIDLTYGRLLCDVYYDGKNLASYFPECQ